MSKRMPKLLLLVALLASLVTSGAAAFGSTACRCYRFIGDRGPFPAPGGCHFDQKTLQCVSVSCTGFCS
jgi:hypothetical protein